MIKALDLFCGAGGASEGLYRAGFVVSGMDIKPQKRYPFPFLKGDAMDVRPRDIPVAYDFIWASPPCQKYSLAQRIQDNNHPDYIADLRKKLKETGLPYVIENVKGAPLIDPIVLCGAMFGLKVYRHRLFECSFPCAQPPHPQHVKPLTKMGRPITNGNFMHVVGNFSGVQRARDSMGIQWMTRDELREAIPPAYSEYIAQQFLVSSLPKKRIVHEPRIRHHEMECHCSCGGPWPCPQTNTGKPYKCGSVGHQEVGKCPRCGNFATYASQSDRGAE
jgi:DNA (cytosine-5)-methyltransferase 1